MVRTITKITVYKSDSTMVNYFIFHFWLKKTGFLCDEMRKIIKVNHQPKCYCTVSDSHRIKCHLPFCLLCPRTMEKKLFDFLSITRLQVYNWLNRSSYCKYIRVCLYVQCVHLVVQYHMLECKLTAKFHSFWSFDLFTSINKQQLRKNRST